MMQTTVVKKLTLLTVAGLLLIGLSGCPCGPDSIAFIPDDALESAIRAALGHPLGCLSIQDLAAVKEIQAAGLSIQNLQGIEHCINLEILNLTSNNIQSITPLQELFGLIYLELGDNQITNIEPLSGLVLLEYLDLFGDGNEIIAWEPLVANAIAGGGLGNGDIIVLPVGTTLDVDNNVLPYWKAHYDALIANGVTIVFADSEGSQLTL